VGGLPGFDRTMIVEECCTEPTFGAAIEQNYGFFGPHPKDYQDSEALMNGWPGRRRRRGRPRKPGGLAGAAGMPLLACQANLGFRAQSETKLFFS